MSWARLLALASLLGCGVVARTEYGAQLQACVDKATNRTEANTCIHTIQLEWTEAGAPPALVFVKDGGVE